MRSLAKTSSIFLTAFLLAGCSSSKTPDHKPKREPAYNFTQSSQVLACVGDMVDSSNGDPIDIFISNIPDHTTPSIESGFLTKNAVMMVTTAVDRMNSPRIAAVGANGGIPIRRQVQILGSFTELNRTSKSKAMSGQAILPGGFELDFGRDENFNHIALDLAMSENNRIVPKTATSVSIIIHGNNGDVTLTYDDDGDYAAVGAIGYTAQEGFHSASRLLIETAVAVMVSRFYGLDITNCLNRARKETAPNNDLPYDKPVFKSSHETGDFNSGTTVRPAANINAALYEQRFVKQKRSIAPPQPSAKIQRNDTTQSADFVWSSQHGQDLTVIPGPGGPRIIDSKPEEYKASSEGDFKIDPPPREDVELENSY